MYYKKSKQCTVIKFIEHRKELSKFCHVISVLWAPSVIRNTWKR